MQGSILCTPCRLLEYARRLPVTKAKWLFAEKLQTERNWPEIGPWRVRLHRPAQHPSGTIQGYRGSTSKDRGQAGIRSTRAAGLRHPTAIQRVRRSSATNIDFPRVVSGWNHSCRTIASVTPETLLAKTFSETKEPAIRATDVLRKHSRVLFAKWLEQLPALGLTPEECDLMATLDLEASMRDFQKITFASFRRGLFSVGEQFAGRGVRIGCVVKAFNLLLELCMPYVTEGKMDSEEPALAGVRLWALAVSIVISGYSKRLQIQQKVLQARLNETARRLHKASAYVTNVYEQERRRLSGLQWHPSIPARRDQQDHPD